ncbi:MAG: MFS transporter [Pseudomonadota bacterium]
MLTGWSRWGAPVATMAVVSIATSYSWPMFALLMERAGYSGAAIGLNATLAALMMVVAAPILPAVMARTGLIPLMLGAGAVSAMALMAVPLADNIVWWSLLRMVLGLTITAMFFASEYWLVEIAPAERRGRIVALYAIILSVSFALGPLMLDWVGFETIWTYALPAGIVLVGLWPVWQGRRHAPEGRAEQPASPRETLGYFRSDPLILWGVVLFGMIEFGAMGLLSVWGIRSGVSEGASLGLLAWMAIGSVLFQLPVGWAADRFDRRKLLALAGAVSALAPMALMLSVGWYWAMVSAVVLWGGMAVSLYTLALTELGARYDGSRLAAGNAAVVLAYGFGAFAAPAAFGQAMDWVPPDGLLWMAAGVALIYTSLALVRLAFVARDPLDNADQIRR